jgi:hypothetical protein
MENCTKNDSSEASQYEGKHIAMKREGKPT